MSRAEVRKNYITAKEGRPELYIDGKKTVPLWFALSDIPGARPWTEYGQKNIRQFAECGVHIVCVDTDLQSGWKEDGSYDAEKPLEEIRHVVKANPDARIIIRLHLNAPYWWMHQNPEELIGYYGMKPIPYTDRGSYGDRVITETRYPTEIRVSFVSEKYHKECGAIIQKLCRCLKKSAYGEHFIGIQVAYGTCGEWHPYGVFDSTPENCAETDFGPAMDRYFRKYLQEKYGTVEKLQAAYHTKETFETVRQATPEERRTLVNGRFRFAKTNARAIDSLVCFQSAITTAISAFCKAVKEYDRDILTGSFYGYYFGCGHVYSAMYEQDRLFADENVDFLAATAPYGKNKRTGNFCMYRHMPESMRLNGMLFLNEMDQGYAAHSAYRGENLVYTCENEVEYAVVLKRNIMENVLRGGAAWFYDHRLRTDDVYHKVGYWDKKERLETITQIRQACEEINKKPFVKTADVLLVFDGQKCYNVGKSFFYNSYDSFDFHDAVMKSGAGVDIIFLSDLTKCELGRYKCVIFAECMTMTQDMYQFVKDKVTDGNRTVVFIDKCGLIVEEEVSESHVEGLLGHPVPEQYTEWGKICYMPEPIVETTFYKELFRRAGAHIYTEGQEVVVADNEMVMVHSKGIKRSVLHLHCGDVEVENGPYQTVVYHTYTGERIL